MPILHEPTDPSLHSSVVSGGNASVGIKSLTRERSIDLACEANIQKGGEGICEVQDEKRTDDTGDTVEVRHGGSDEEAEDPVDGTESVPHPFTPLGGDLREVQDLLEDLNVHCLHSDVEVEQACYTGCYQPQNIVDLLQFQGLYHVSDVRSGVLAVLTVDKRTEEDVDNSDEKLCAEHSLPEIPRVTHLSQESDEEKSTTP